MLMSVRSGQSSSWVELCVV